MKVSPQYTSTLSASASAETADRAEPGSSRPGPAARYFADEVGVTPEVLEHAITAVMALSDRDLDVVRTTPTKPHHIRWAAQREWRLRGQLKHDQLMARESRRGGGR